MRTKIAKRESCICRDVNFQIQIQEEYPKEKLAPRSQDYSSMPHMRCKRTFHLKNGEFKPISTTDDFRVTLQTPGIICKVPDLGCYVIYLSTHRNRPRFSFF